MITHTSRRVESRWWRSPRTPFNCY